MPFTFHIMESTVGLIFDRNELERERLERFQAYLRKNVHGRRIRWNTPADACGAKCLAGHMRDYVAMREGRELDWHQCPATFFGIHHKLWFNLVMVKGHSYKVNTKVLDMTSADVRHAVSSQVVEHLILNGGVAWYPAIRDAVGREAVDDVVKWNYDAMG